MALFGRDRDPVASPAWAASGGPRILVEEADASAAWAMETDLARAGYRVSLCPGPDRLLHGGCPELRGRHCQIAAAADVIVFSLGLSRAQDCDLLVAHRTAGRTLCIQVPTRVAERQAGFLASFAAHFDPAVFNSLRRVIARITRRDD